MERARPILRERDTKDPRVRARKGIGRVAVGGFAAAAALLLTGCDSAVGIPNEDPDRAVAKATTTTPPAAAPTTSATSTRPPIPTDAPPVGAVPGLPGAAPALQRWAADLRTDTTTELQAKCWNMAPANVTDMYASKQTILTALAQPGTVAGDIVSWKSRTTTVTADKALLDTGYACPRVVTTGGDTGLNAADARHTVRRYLARFVGAPLDPADQEDAYPLVCKASPAAWDPNGTGRVIPAPLANNPGKLTGVTEFDDQEISSDRPRGDYIAVYVPVTNSSGVTQTRTFTLSEGAEGYCIGDVSP